MGYDLGSMETRKFAEEGVDFQLVHPVTGPIFDNADPPQPVTIKLGGADSARIKTAVRERQRRRKEEQDKLPPDAPVPDYDWKTREDDTIEDLVTLTFGWSANLELDGEPYPFSKENAEKLYRRFPEIAEQMQAKATKRINFMRPLSTK